MEITYTEPTKARAIVEARLEDAELWAAAMEMIGDMPEGSGIALGSLPKAVLADYLAWTARSTHEFAAKARELGFEPNIATYISDFVSWGNKKKVAMLNPTFCFADPREQVWHPKRNTEGVLVKGGSGGSIGSFQTKFGVDLATMWQAIRLASDDPNIRDVRAWDMSEWYKQEALRNGWDPDDNESKATFYYTSLMVVYVFTAVFVDYRQFPKFTYADTAFTKVCDALGVAPVIVPFDQVSDLPPLGGQDRQVNPYFVDLTSQPDINRKNVHDWIQQCINTYRARSNDER